MLFNFIKKIRREEPSTSSAQSSGEDISKDSDYLTSNLYKQNAEIVSKNKSLSISKKLYDVSILALETKELSKRIVKIIQEELEMELVGILLYVPEKKEFVPISFVSSRRLSDVQAELKFDFSKIKIPIDSTQLIKDVIQNKISLHNKELSNIWDSAISKKQYKELNLVGHIKTSLVSPLVIEDKVIGLSIFSMNRPYENLSDHEIETISNFSNIMAVAIDRSIVYEKLTRTNKQLAQANIRLEELSQQKSEFVSLASHQLRSPLTAIKGYISLVLDGDFGEISSGVRDALEKVRISTNSLSTLVGDYLDVSRIELGRMKYEFSVFLLNDLIKEIVDETKPNFDKSKLDLNVDIEKNPVYIKADKNKIKQVFLNIIDNSVKYTLSGSISITLVNKDGLAIFKVKDTGLGISKEMIPKIFKKFSRASNAEESKIGGAGLGLYLAKKIAEEHHANIYVESDGEGKGSTFVVELKTVTPPTPQEKALPSS